MSKALLFLAGVLVGALLLQPQAVETATALMFGSYSNAAKAITVTSTGAVQVFLN